MDIYIANESVLHHVDNVDWGEFLEVNGQRVDPKQCPQVLPPGYKLEAWRDEEVVDHYERIDGTVVGVDEYKANEMKFHRDIDELPSDDDIDSELAWRKWSKGIVPVSRTERKPLQVGALNIIHFQTFITGEQYIECMPSFLGYHAEDYLREGKFFMFRPDHVQMLKDAVKRAGLDEKLLEPYEDMKSDFRFTKYAGEYIDDKITCVDRDYLTLDDAKAARGNVEKKLDAWLADYKARHAKVPLRAGEVVSALYKFLERLDGIDSKAATADRKRKLKQEIEASIEKWSTERE